MIDYLLEYPGFPKKEFDKNQLLEDLINHG